MNKSLMKSLCIGLVLAAEMLLLVDAAVVFCGGLLSIREEAMLFAALLAVILLVSKRLNRQLRAAALLIPSVLAVVSITGYCGWRVFTSNAHYQFPDSGKNQMFGDRSVMVIVPHQDDELNVLGGVMEEYVRYGSELYGVFVTNGDYLGMAETRFEEAVAVFESMGVQEENVIFLGYGDEWQADGPHIYNAPSGKVMTSHFGRRETYGTENYGAYREGREYTIDHLTEDLKSVILEHRPDVIVCSDYDHHVDHKAVTLLFDKAMGQILKENPGYTPVVYKAYAYGTAWEADPDYYDADHVLSTRNPFEEPYRQHPAVYHWEDRIRFPVSGAVLSRSLVGSEAFARLSIHESPGANAMAAAVINGDKVAWRRYTDSLCLKAEITADSGDVQYLNDFMLIENHNIADPDHMPYDGVWSPDDAEKTAEIHLNRESDVALVVLYDHPSPEQNVLDAVIRFDDGTQIRTGPLDPEGAATRIPVGKHQVKSFQVILERTEGETAGLSEIEAFAQMPEQDGRFIKLTDMEGNFLYDYTTAADGVAELLVYAHGDLPKLTAERYSVATAWGAGTAKLENGVIKVSCPVGESITVNVTCSEAGVSDSITVHNPRVPERLWNDLWRNAEHILYSCYSRQGHNKLVIPSLITKIDYTIRHML